MNLYEVTYPIVGEVWVEVEAESEQEAKEKAQDIAETDGDVSWEAVDKVTQGNVFLGPRNKVDVELVEENIEE